MSSTLRKSAVALCTGALLIGGAGSASAQHSVDQDGLVNVSIGNVNILRDVNLNLAAQVAANICGLQVGDVLILAAQVDTTDAEQTVVCNARNGRQALTITD